MADATTSTTDPSQTGLARRAVQDSPPPMGPRMRRGPGSVIIETARDPGRAFRRLVVYLGPEAPLLLVAMSFVLLSVASRSISPALVGTAIRNSLELQQDLPGFLRRLAVIFGLAVGGWAGDAVSGIMVNRIANDLVFRLRQESFAHIQRLSMSYFDRAGIGDLVSRLTNDVETISSALTSGFSNLAGGVLSVIGVLIAMLSLSLPLTVVVIVIVPLMLAATGIVGRRVRVVFRENQRFVGLLSAGIEESVSGVRAIKAFHREEAEFRSFDAVNVKATDVGTKAEFTAYLLSPILNFVTSLSVALMVAIGGTLVLSHSHAFSIGLLTSFLLYARRFFQPLRQMTDVYNVLQSALAGAERLFEVLDTESETRPRAGARRIHIRGDIEFEDVRFGYDPGRPVLDGISFRVEAGRTVAIVGHTGAGKTTIVNLLARHYDVDSGRILVDGTDIRDHDAASLRSQMGVVLQEPFFFARTVRENLLYGNPAASERQMIDAAVLANADQFVRRLPGQYDFALIERGENISQGQRQLLAIARAILADPRILILDEATSNVDSLTEIQIQQGLLRLMQGRTSVIIAHRLSTIKNADKVLVIHDHRIVEEGSHPQLMQAGGFYSRLYSLQIANANATEVMPN